MNNLPERDVAYFLSLAQQAKEASTDAQRTTLWNELDQEYDALQAALRGLAQQGNAEPGLRLLTALYWFWVNRHLEDGQQWFAAFLALPSASARTALRAQALDLAAGLAFNKGLYFETDPAATRADYAAATALGEEALAIRRELGDRAGEGVTLIHLSYMPFREGDPATARTLLEESLGIFRELGHTWGIAASAGSVAGVALDQRDYQTACDRYREALTSWRELGHSGEFAGAMEGLAVALASVAQPERALRLAASAAAWRDTTGNPRSPEAQARVDSALEQARGALDDATQSAVWAAGQAMTLEQAVTEALEEPASEAFPRGA
jgi:hypothetical protein